MTQLTKLDQDGVFQVPQVLERTERLYVKELARFLHHSSGEIMRFARARRILHHSTGTKSRNRVYWLTPHGAILVIAHIRVLQAEWVSNNGGRDFHRDREMVAKRMNRYRARKTAESRG